MADAVLYFEDVAEGDEAPTLTHVLTRTDLVAYAGASGDYNPMHHDEVKATAAGQPSVFGHGMFSMGLLGTAITGYVGAGNVTRFTVRFARQTWPGEELHSSITVTGTRSEGDLHLIDMDVRLAHDLLLAVGVGEATAKVPSKA